MVPLIELRLWRFQRSRGVVIGAYYFDLEIGMAFFVEILALIQGIEYVHQRG